MKIGIIQPGRLGDIILCLPIAKYYYDQGYEVIWPIFDSYISTFQPAVNYVTFLPVNHNIHTCVTEAYKILSNYALKINIHDLAATFPGSVCTEKYVKMGDGLGKIKADEFKYIQASVPIEEKWKLNIIRNEKKERELFQKYVHQNDYAVICLTSSQGKLNINIDCGDKQLIEMNENHGIFDWLTILEQAKILALVNSSISNLVEMMNFQNKKYLLPRPDGRMPTLKNKWEIINL